MSVPMDDDTLNNLLNDLGIHHALTDSVEDIVIEIKKRGRGRWQSK